MELWLPVPQWENQYEVSNQGQVRSVERKVWMTNRWGQPMQRTVPSRIRSASLNKDGYLYLTLHPGRIHWFVHQLVLTAFDSPCPPGLVCRHLNGVRTDNRRCNLKWGTPAENAQDAVEHGTHRNTRKFECKHGHEFTPENTYVRPDGRGRSCVACMKQYQKDNGARHARERRARNHQ